MKKHSCIVFFALFTLSICFVLFAGSARVQAAKKEVHIQPRSLTMVTGCTDRQTLVLTDDKKIITDGVTFYSENPKVINIAETGRLIIDNKQTKIGSTRLVCTYQGKKYYCNFSFVQPSMKKDKVTLTLGKKNHNSEKLQMNGIIGADGKELPCKWHSSKPNIVTVSKKGKITAKREGRAQIICDVNSQGKYICEVTVRSRGVTQVSLDQTSLDLQRNEKQRLTATVKPNNVSVKGVTWSTEDAKVATVSENGTVTAVGPGDTVIRAESKENEGYFATCKVHVRFNPDDVKLSLTEMTLYWTAKSITLTDKSGSLKSENITWRVQDPSIVKLDDEITEGYTNTITAKKKGTTEVIAVVKAPDGKTYEYSCKVTSGVENYGLEVTVSKRDSKGENSLSIDGIITLTITNHTTSDLALFRENEGEIDEDNKEQPILTMSAKYDMLFRYVEENDKMFGYNGNSQVSCIKVGESKVYSLIVQEDKLQEVKRTSYNFRSANLSFYLYDTSGVRHQIVVSGADVEGNILSEKVEDDIQTSAPLKSWR